MAVKSNSTPCGAIAVVSENAWLRNEALGDVLRRLRDAHGDALDVSTVDGREVEVRDVLDDVRTPSMFAGMRVVVVEDGETLISRFRETLEKYLSEPSPTGMLILKCKALDRRTRICKLLTAADAVIESEAPRGRSVATWIVRRARTAYGKSIGDREAELIRELTGDDVGLLDSELSKLAVYVGARSTIQREDIELLVGSVREENVFALLDDMADGNIAGAISRWQQVLATDPAARDRSIGGLAWGVRQLLEASRVRDAGRGQAPPFRGKWVDPARLETRLRRTSTRQLEERLAGLMRVDVAVKSGAGTIGSAVEKWIVEHAAPSA